MGSRRVLCRQPRIHGVRLRRRRRQTWECSGTFAGPAPVCFRQCNRGLALPCLNGSRFHKNYFCDSYFYLLLLTLFPSCHSYFTSSFLQAVSSFEAFRFGNFAFGLPFYCVLLFLRDNIMGLEALAMREWAKRVEYDPKVATGLMFSRLCFVLLLHNGTFHWRSACIQSVWIPMATVLRVQVALFLGASLNHVLSRPLA